MADHDKQHTMSVLAPATAVATSLALQPGPGLTFSNPFDRSLAYPDSQFSIPLASTAHTTIVKRALSVDRERHPDGVKVVMEEFESGLSMSVSPSSPIPRPRRSRWLTPFGSRRTIQTTTLRLLRMNVNSLFENLDLIIRTIDGLNFGDEAPAVLPAATS